MTFPFTCRFIYFSPLTITYFPLFYVSVQMFFRAFYFYFVLPLLFSKTGIYSECVEITDLAVWMCQWLKEVWGWRGRILSPFSTSSLSLPAPAEQQYWRSCGWWWQEWKSEREEGGGVSKRKVRRDLVEKSVLKRIFRRKLQSWKVWMKQEWGRV